MRIPLGIVGSVLGATLAFFLALIALITLPSDGASRWLAMGGLITVSVVAGLVINGGSIQEYRKLLGHFRETANLYDTLQSRLCPMVYSAVEDVLQRRVKLLDLDGHLNLIVCAPAKGFYRIVGSTFPLEDPIRQIELDPDEGVTGFVVNRKVVGYSPAAWQDEETANHNRPVFDRSGRLIGEATPLRPVNKGRISVTEKWVYCRPIFERSAAIPWSNRLMGLFVVLSTADDGDSLFKNPDFQHQVDSLASDVAPYLDVLRTLIAEEKA